MKQVKIAFGYKMGSGKDTAVDYLIDKHGGQRLSFAGPIYDILNYAQTVCGFPKEKDRKFLQWVGTEWGRNINNNVWVDTAIRNTPKEGNVFVSDLRFLNEFDALKKNGWLCVRLDRCVEDNREGSGTTLHSSENDLDEVPYNKWDYVIDNNETLENFFNKLDFVYKH